MVVALDDVREVEREEAHGIRRHDDLAVSAETAAMATTSALTAGKGSRRRDHERVDA